MKRAMLPAEYRLGRAALANVLEVHRALERSLAPLLPARPTSEAEVLAAAAVSWAVAADAAAAAPAPPVPIACRAGCSSCCYQHTAASGIELLAIVLWLRQHLAPDSLAALAAHAQELAGRIEGTVGHRRFRARVPCALLTPDGRCGAYEVRPLLCRGHNSIDADECARSQHVTSYYGWAIPYSAAQAVLGDRAGRYELTLGLSLLLSDPSLIARWLSGEPVLSPAILSMDKVMRAGVRLPVIQPGGQQ